MSRRITRIHLPLFVLCLILINTFQPLKAQFEQQLSVNLSAGYFNTIGWSSYALDGAPASDPEEPTLMPNFTAGVSIQGGLQYNFSRHFSVEFQLGYSFSPGWYYNYSGDDSDPFNYLSYEVYVDTIDYEVESSGENYMDLTNFHVGIAPRYYFSPGSRFNPFLYAGISMNITDVYFDNTEYAAFEEAGKLDQYQEPYDLINWFDYHYGLGFMVGAGAEFALNDYLGLFAMASYQFVPLKEEAFLNGNKHADFHAINIHLGARISFLKSKDL